ncbi:MAG: hypothetical protein IJV96_02625, partial [Clostridia bacterium]|nr:hypothetical protein [Clostridia bacterium]
MYFPFYRRKADFIAERFHSNAVWISFSHSENFIAAGFAPQASPAARRISSRSDFIQTQFGFHSRAARISLPQA